jgi:hypothetical protein
VPRARAEHAIFGTIVDDGADIELVGHFIRHPRLDIIQSAPMRREAGAKNSFFWSGSLSSARRARKFEGSDRLEQSSHPHKRPRAQRQDQASHD